MWFMVVWDCEGNRFYGPIWTYGEFQRVRHWAGVENRDRHRSGISNRCIVVHESDLVTVLAAVQTGGKPCG